MIKIKLALDRIGTALFSRWGNVAFNGSLFVVFVLVALFSEPGGGRDWMWFIAGLNFGFGLFWFISPWHKRHLEPEMVRALEAEAALILAALALRANEAMGMNISIVPKDDPGAPPADTRH